jgi:transposase-like protein
MVKICDGVVTNRPVYLAIGVDCESVNQALGRGLLRVARPAAA